MPSSADADAAVFKIAQTRQHQRAQPQQGTRGNGELPVNDAQRYRMNAAECLSAAERRESPYRSPAFTIAAYWLSLARQQEAVDGLLAAGIEARSATTPAPIRPLQYSGLQAREAFSA
jgi:hypothetical protein